MVLPRVAEALVCLLACSAAVLAADPSAVGLIFYQDFDHHGEALCGDGWAVDQPVPAQRLVPGRFGRACRFEAPEAGDTAARARDPDWIDLAAWHPGFTGRRGTLACWVRPLRAQDGVSRPVGAAVAIGNGWFTGLWQLGGRTWYAGQSPTKQPQGKLSGAAMEKRLAEPGAHDGWHHLLLAWDEREAVGYLDGQAQGRAPLLPDEPATDAVLRLGGSVIQRAAMTGDLDEVVLYGRRLADAEIEALAAARSPLADRVARLLVRRPARLEFLRSEAESQIPLALVAYGCPAAPGRLVARIGDLNASLDAPVAPGQVAALSIKPWRRSPGKFPLSVEATMGPHTVRAADSIEIFPQPPTPEFIIYAWGGTDADLEQRGFNCLFGDPRTLLRRGLWATVRIDVRDKIPHPWSAPIRAKAAVAAAQVARKAMAGANVRACLVNSELSNPPFPAGEKWFLDWMRAETGLAQIPPEVEQGPLRVAAQAPGDVPALLPDDYPPYKFLRWWAARGQGHYLLNNEIAATMRRTGLKTTYYSDQPEVPSQFAALDLVDFWAYPKSPEGLVARFSHASCLARLAGKPFQAMPGTIYWDDGGGLWITGPDGNRKVLCLSPDCLKENLWISVACPTASIGLYGIGERRTGLYDTACDAAMTDAYRLIQPAGVLVGGLPCEQAKVALLETDGLDFIQPGVRDKWTRHWLMRTASRVTARARVNFDWITDDHVAAGWLDRYQAVVVPGAWALPEQTHRALVKFARAGGQVVADRVMRAEIPGATRLNIDTQSYPDEPVLRELGIWADSVRPKTQGWATVAPADKVFTYTREDGPARWLFIVNDHRRSGPQQRQWNVRVNAIGRMTLEPLRDEGLPQDVTVTLPQGFALYDVLGHRRLTASDAGGRAELTIHLEPGGAALVAALPRALKRLKIRVPERIQTGREAVATLEVLDEAGQAAPGRQLAEIRVTQPDGRPWAGVDRYRRVLAGKLDLPLRLPVEARPGAWKLEILEWTSGLRTEAHFAVVDRPTEEARKSQP